MSRLVLGIREAAAVIGISAHTLRRYIRQGRVSSVRIGRRVLVEPAELERIVAEGRRERCFEEKFSAVETWVQRLASNQTGSMSEGASG